MKKQQRCYIYTRVSTSMRVDGYSLDAQKDKLHKYADYQDMIIAGEYSDEGKSGKSVEGRPQFQQMLQDIESGKDNVDFVLVFKLSRFGRNAADVLSSLQRMQDFGVNLICVEDGIDSSKDAGKLMISVLSAVAEIERENILVQTMEGRRQKAREGKWNGGFAPYGYQLINGELHIAEDEAEIIRIIYDKFANTTMGIAAIATFLNNSGYKKKLRQNNTIEGFSTSFVKGVLDNPVYCGKLAFGRRKNEKIAGTRNAYHIVKQDKYMLNDGIYEAIVSEELWNQVHKKRQETGVANIKTHSLDHEHILSGIIKCPICRSGMYGNVNRKKHPDGGHYKDYFYYACKHRTFVNGHKCTYRKQWSEDKINAAVEEVIRKLVNNPKFKTEIQKHIGQSIDTQELDREHTGLQERLKQVNGAKNKLANQMDNLSVSDKHYDKKYEDMQVRLDKLYDEIEEIETLIEEVETRLYNIRQEKISADNVYQFLLFFDKLYDRFTDIEKKTFMKSFLADVNIYEEEQTEGRILRSLKFRFPVFFNGKEVYELDWDNESTVESIVCLSREKANAPSQNFRIAQHGDEEQVLSLYQRAKSGAFCVWNDSYPSIAEIAHDLETYNLYVMTDGSKIIGAISVVPENELDDFHCWSCKSGKEIARVVIDTAYQGQGLSFEMVQRIESVLREKGHISIRLSVVKSNIPAYKTYIKAGFTVVGEAQMYGNDYYLMDKVIDTTSLPKRITDETVVLLSRKTPDDTIEVDLDLDELDITSAESKATYQEIKDYVLEHSGLKVSSLYIAQVKQQCGIIERENYNKPKSEGARGPVDLCSAPTGAVAKTAKQPGCPPDKEKAIKEALTHFGMI